VAADDVDVVETTDVADDGGVTIGSDELTDGVRDGVCVVPLVAESQAVRVTVTHTAAANAARARAAGVTVTACQRSWSGACDRVRDRVKPVLVSGRAPAAGPDRGTTNSMPVTAKNITGTAVISVLTIAGLAACSSSGNGGAAASKTPTTATSTASSTPAPPPASSAAPAPADAATKAAVIKAYTTFFGGTTDPAALVADLQNGDQLAAALAQEAKNPTAATLTATVSSVLLANPHVANVTFTLLSKGAPLLKDTPGNAVLENGVWKLAAGTFCGLVAASGQTPAACTDTTITGLPAS
jgi:hypothetical protein